MPAGAHGGVPAAAAAGLGCPPVTGRLVLASFAGAVDGGTDGAEGVGLAHALPSAAVGGVSRLFAAAADWRATMAARLDGG
jgi:hypothetical protein